MNPLSERIRKTHAEIQQMNRRATSYTWSLTFEDMEYMRYMEEKRYGR